eukprot:TRINITY_DN4998_c1_g1_i1.p1 TRINITY_DN4998_c1_g1~~TRINITY_DN4998_c1_g1_i1.p1  ORF type:complete len:488 (+),score=129.12 TRINITY_DN4998_c1_g1_i1:67-1530(+)
MRAGCRRGPRACGSARSEAVAAPATCGGGGRQRRHCSGGTHREAAAPERRTIRDEEAEVRRRLEAAYRNRDEEHSMRLAAAAAVAQGEGLPESLRDAVFTPVAEAFSDGDRAAARRPPRDSILQPDNPKVLRVAVIGPPNGGKSALVNNLVADHITAVTPREETTLQWTRGITTVGDAQLILLDTPPLWHPLPAVPADRNWSRRSEELKLRRRLGCTLAAWDALHGADAVLVAVDGSWGVLEQRVTQLLSALQARVSAMERRLPVFVALTRCDLLRNRGASNTDMASFVDAFAENCPLELAAAPFRSSTREADSIQHIRRMLAVRAVPGEWGFPQGQTTDLTPPEHVEELIREKLFRFVRYEQRASGGAALFVRATVVGWTPRSNGSLDIDVLAVFSRREILRQFRKDLGVICEKVVLAVEKTVKRRARVTFHCQLYSRGENSWEWPNPYRWHDSDGALRRRIDSQLDLLRLPPAAGAAEGAECAAA